MSRAFILVLCVALSGPSVLAQQPGWEELSRQGQQQCEQGKYAEAEATLQRALGAGSPEPPAKANILVWLGSVYTRESKYRDAEAALGEASDIIRQSPPAGRTALARCLTARAELYMITGDLKAAVPLFQQSLEIYQEELGDTHRMTAIASSNLGAAYVRLGDTARAEPLLKRARALEEAALGPEHPEVAGTLEDLGHLYAAQGKFSLAEPLLKRALAIDEKALGPAHPLLASILNELALAYIKQKRPALAEPLLQRAVTIGENNQGVMGEELTSLRWLAEVYKQTGRFAAAELTYQRAVELCAKTFGPNDQGLLVVLREYVTLLKRDRAGEVRALNDRIKAIQSSIQSLR